MSRATARHSRAIHLLGREWSLNDEGARRPRGCVLLSFFTCPTTCLSHTFVRHCSTVICPKRVAFATLEDSSDAPNPEYLGASGSGKPEPQRTHPGSTSARWRPPSDTAWELAESATNSGLAATETDPLASGARERPSRRGPSPTRTFGLGRRWFGCRRSRHDVERTRGTGRSRRSRMGHGG